VKQDDMLQLIDKTRHISCDQNIDQMTGDACGECLTCMVLTAFYKVVDSHRMGYTGVCVVCGYKGPCATLGGIGKALSW